MILFKDISGVGQSVYDMDANPDQMIMMKMSGGDGVNTPLYFDDQAARNYNNAIRLNKIPFMYHFYGGGDPVVEADYFFKAVSPLAVGDGYALDIERGTRWNPQTDPLAVAKVTAYVNHFHDMTGVWMWVYMNMSTANMYDWSPVFNNCAYWCAAPSYGFNDTLPVKYPQTAQQGPIVDGVDTDAAFVPDLDHLKLFTYQGATSEPQPSPQPTPAPAPAPEPPVIAPPIVPAPDPSPAIPNDPPTSPPTPDTSLPPIEQGSGTNNEQTATGGTPAPEPRPSPGLPSRSLTLWQRIVAWFKSFFMIH